MKKALWYVPTIKYGVPTPEAAAYMDIGGHLMTNGADVNWYFVPDREGSGLAVAALTYRNQVRNIFEFKVA